MVARVATASETVACERAAIAQGTPAAELMRRAGEAAAELIVARYPERLGRGVVVFAGQGNNGGDGWVVAASLVRRGIRCRVASTGEQKSEHARHARNTALASGASESALAAGDEALFIDALLGTGSSGPPKDAVAEAIDIIVRGRDAGATVIALDLPTGLDATTGEHSGSLTADFTVSFGVMKRGHLLARNICGHLAVADIGMACPELELLPVLVDAAWVKARVPAIPAAAHKGTRKSLTVVGGGRGMAGASILAGEGALRAGIGLLRISVEEGNEVAIHAGIPSAIVQQWPRDASQLASNLAGVDAVAIGPGLGKSPGTRDLVERILLAFSGPVVVDADALNVFQNDALSLAQLLNGRPAVITPHPAEFARLAGVAIDEVVDGRFDIGLELAAQLGAAVLLKGSPTVIFSPSGERLVCAAGTAALATGGSGDVLTGMIGTLAAQMCGGDNPAGAAEAAACSAFVHGRAAELCGRVRGTTLSDILEMMPLAWELQDEKLPPDVLAILESH